MGVERQGSLESASDAALAADPEAALREEHRIALRETKRLAESTARVIRDHREAWVAFDPRDDAALELKSLVLRVFDLAGEVIATTANVPKFWESSEHRNLLNSMLYRCEMVVPADLESATSGITLFVHSAALMARETLDDGMWNPEFTYLLRERIQSAESLVLEADRLRWQLRREWPRRPPRERRMLRGVRRRRQVLPRMRRLPSTLDCLRHAKKSVRCSSGG